MEHAAHALLVGLGTGSDICCHTSSSLADVIFCRQLCSHCSVPAGWSQRPWSVRCQLSPNTNKCFPFSSSPLTHFFPLFKCRWFIQKAIFAPDAGFSYVNGDLLYFIPDLIELSWLPETAPTTLSTCQCFPWGSANPLSFSLTPVFPPPLTLVLPHSNSLQCWIIYILSFI